MHWLDITILVVLGLGMLFGFRSGLLWQIARLITFAIAVYVCLYHHELAASWLAGFLHETPPPILKILAYVATFLTVYVVCYTITFAIEQAVKAAQLKFLDRMLGAGLGLAKAGLLAGAILMGAALYATPAIEEALATSKFAPHLLAAFRAVLVVVPQHTKEDVGTAVDRIKEVAAEKARGAAGAALRHTLPVTPPTEDRPRERRDPAPSAEPPG